MPEWAGREPAGPEPEHPPGAERAPVQQAIAESLRGARPGAGATLDRLVAAEAMREVGLEALLERAAAGESPAELALEAWPRRFDGPPLLSDQKRLQLERAAAQLDRLEGRVGAGAEWIVRRIYAFDLTNDLCSGPYRPRSLGFYALALRRHSRGRLRAARAAAGERESAEPAPWRTRVPSWRRAQRDGLV